MIKGCAKRVVVVRNMDSNLFEEAFFIVKAGQGAKKSTEEEFLGEAERLVKTTPVQSSVDSGTDTPAQARFRIAPKTRRFPPACHWAVRLPRLAMGEAQRRKKRICCICAM